MAAAALNRPSQSADADAEREKGGGRRRRAGGARNHLASVMEAVCGVKLSAVANGPVIAAAPHSPRCLRLKGGGKTRLEDDQK